MSRSRTKGAASNLGQLPFTWVYENQPKKEASGTAGVQRPAPANSKAEVPKINPADEKQVRSDRSERSKVKRSLREIVERYLRDKGVPYINVDEAKKALFAGAKLRSFHFVVYFSDRRNWLLYTSQLRKESREDLLQWEQIFGDGFVAVVAKQMKEGAFTFKTLSGDVLPPP